MFRPFLGLCALSLFTSSVPVAAQNATPLEPLSSPQINEPELSLEELLRLARQNNPQLPIARENREAARERAGATRAFQNPQLQLVPGFTGSREARDEEIILSQPLDLFGQRRAQRGVAQAELRRAETELTLAQRSLVVQVKNSAADLFAAQEAENLGQSGVEIARLFRDAAARKAQLGDVPPVQRQRAELELLRVQNELTSARAERLARRAALNSLIGQAPETPLRVALPVSSALSDLLKTPFALANPGLGGAASGASGSVGGVPITPPLQNAPSPTTNAPLNLPQNPTLGASSQVGSDLIAGRDQFLSGALVRPDIVGAQATLEAQRAQVAAIGRARLPQIEIQARRSAFFGRDGSTALRAVVNVPLFDFGSIGGQKRAAQADVRAQEARINLLRQQAATQVEQALIRLGQQRQMVETYRTGIVPQTLDLLRKTQIGYTAGASTYLEVLDAQRTLRQVQTEYLQALVGVRSSEAALESALGSGLSGDLTGMLSNPSGPAALPGTAAPGTVPQSTFAPNPIAPLGAPPINTLPTSPTAPNAPQGGR
ncbi:Outer membrane protein TolC [Abditibacterium utsteinense]|uniref:Outer membrane protein TolC n=1 Tax=Abditibacterium utsteinense TaxID=1960156 RepID=A0A2S8SPI4_9BACT|nr:TolC family protein [Abditibacterium utsteinense]PQV62689.1 Outer membrane protein TolC [Abditibacterium utsteinense]